MKEYKFRNIVCFGEILWDMLPAGKKPGGAPFNVAIHLKRHGFDPIFVSRTGDDTEGQELIEFTQKTGISTDFIQVDKDLPTGKVIVTLDKHKNATYEICEPVAWDNIQVSAELIQCAKDADIIVYGSLASRNRRTYETLTELFDNSDAQRILDVNLRPPYLNRELIAKLMSEADFIKLNLDELVEIASWYGKNGKPTKLMRWLSDYFQISDVCATRGENGAIYLSHNQLFKHKGIKVETVETVGAGDAFLAGMISGISKFDPPEKILDDACIVGAFVTTQHGAVPEYNLNEVSTLIKKA